jgi:hypothetical protein
MRELLNNISREDFVIWKPKTKELVEDADIVYHYTTIIEMINNFDLSLQDDEEIICVASLPWRLQEEINSAIELTK